MSELINTRPDRGNIRWHLLASVSATALLVVAAVSQPARAGEDGDHPTFWIELGGQVEHVDGGLSPYAPSFLSPLPSFISDSPLNIERPARYSYGAEGKVSFQPQGTDWVFTAGVRYGRSIAKRHVHEQPPTAQFTAPSGYVLKKYSVNFADTKVRNSEAHVVLDFQAGKDVGLGMMGHHSTSTLSFGVRFAQFNTRSQSDLKVVPDVNPPSSIYAWESQLFQGSHHHSHLANADITRSFSGIGPAIAWNASAPFAGNPEAAEFTFDWGLNAAVLFGRQKAAATHQSSVINYDWILGRGRYVSTTAGLTIHHARSRSVVVPNVGGFAGLSLKFPNAKVSLGYRADMFFGAMDGGVDTRQTYNRDFYGPFATVSIGLGG